MSVPCTLHAMLRKEDTILYYYIYNYVDVANVGLMLHVICPLREN